MEPPTIVEKPGMKVAGAGCAFVHVLSPDGNTMDTVGRLWGTWFEARRRVVNQVDADTSFGIVWGKPAEERSHPDELQYICAAEVTSFEGMPEDVATFEVPAGEYAVFTHRGPITEIGTTVGFAYREWLPNSGYVRRGICDVEVYGLRFCSDGPDSEMEYRIPVKRASPAQAD